MKLILYNYCTVVSARSVFYGTETTDIAQGEAECNISFRGSIKTDIARDTTVIVILYGLKFTQIKETVFSTIDINLAEK